MKNINILQEKKTKLVIYIILTVFVILLFGCVLFPQIFYDNFIWKYYWGPIVADTTGGIAIHNGVIADEGYTYVSEITYGIILIIALFYIYKLLKKLKIVVDWRFALALMPYIFYGPVSRVLEDADFFNIPTVYWFISPLIYIQIGFFAILFLVLGWYFEQKTRENKDVVYCLFYPVFILLIVNVFFTFLWVFGAKTSLDFFDPFTFYLISCIAVLPVFYSYLKKKTLSVNTYLFSGGLLFLLPGLYLMGKWIMGLQWSVSTGVRFDVFLLVLGLVCLFTFLVYFVAYVFRKNEKILVYKKPLNLTMFFGHLLDGITTYISIHDPLSMGLNYSEKHPASDTLLSIWGPLFPIVKFVLIILVVYVFDILYKKDLKNYVRLVNLLKIGIIILGFSPGLRDLLRVTMGV